MPYIYGSMEETTRTGIPLMRPIFVKYPEAKEFYGEEREFLFGRDLLVAPQVVEMPDAYEVKLPPGHWYDYWTGTKFSSGKPLQVHPPLDSVPLYVRAGAILPQQPVVQYTDRKSTRLNSSHGYISYAVFCLKKKTKSSTDNN